MLAVRHVSVGYDVGVEASVELFVSQDGEKECSQCTSPYIDMCCTPIHYTIAKF